MESALAKLADVTLKLKRQYQSLLGASPAYGEDKKMTKEMDTMGLLLKELEDSVVFLQIKLDERRSEVANQSESSPPGIKSS